MRSLEAACRRIDPANPEIIRRYLLGQFGPSLDQPPLTSAEVAEARDKVWQTFCRDRNQSPANPPLESWRTVAHPACWEPVKVTLTYLSTGEFEACAQVAKDRLLVTPPPTADYPVERSLRRIIPKPVDVAALATYMTEARSLPVYTGPSGETLSQQEVWAKIAEEDDGWCSGGPAYTVRFRHEVIVAANPQRSQVAWRIQGRLDGMRGDPLDRLTQLEKSTTDNPTDLPFSAAHAISGLRRAWGGNKLSHQAIYRLHQMDNLELTDFVLLVSDQDLTLDGIGAWVNRHFATEAPVVEDENEAMEDPYEGLPQTHFPKSGAVDIDGNNWFPAGYGGDRTNPTVTSVFRKTPGMPGLLKASNGRFSEEGDPDMYRTFIREWLDQTPQNAPKSDVRVHVTYGPILRWADRVTQHIGATNPLFVWHKGKVVGVIMPIRTDDADDTVDPAGVPILKDGYHILTRWHAEHGDQKAKALEASRRWVYEPDGMTLTFKPWPPNKANYAWIGSVQPGGPTLWAATRSILVSNRVSAPALPDWMAIVDPKRHPEVKDIDQQILEPQMVYKYLESLLNEPLVPESEIPYLVYDGKYAKILTSGDSVVARGKPFGMAHVLDANGNVIAVVSPLREVKPDSVNLYGGPLSEAVLQLHKDREEKVKVEAQRHREEAQRRQQAEHEAKAKAKAERQAQVKLLTTKAIAGEVHDAQTLHGDVSGRATCRLCGKLIERGPVSRGKHAPVDYVKAKWASDPYRPTLTSDIQFHAECWDQVPPHIRHAVSSD